MNYIQRKQSTAISKAKAKLQARRDKKIEREMLNQRIRFWREAWKLACHKYLPANYSGSILDIEGKALISVQKYMKAAFRGIEGV